MFNITTQDWSDTLYIPTTDFKIEGVCLYQDQASNGFVFILDEEGHGAQWLVADASSPLAQPKLIRELSTPPNSEYCQVDDSQDLMYINEENVGVWAYDAHSEADLIRQPVALNHPFGLIKGSAAGMHIIPGGLLILDADDNNLYTYVTAGNQWHHDATFSLAGLSEPNNLSARVKNKQLEIIIKHNDGMTFFTLPWSHKDSQPKRLIQMVKPEVETIPVPSLGDAADDPAIWINTQKAQHSRILGTDKQGGLLVYNLAGDTLQNLPVGRLNNVDIRTGFNFNGHQIDLAIASNRDHNSLHVFAIQPNTGVVSELGEISTTIEDIYGLCMFKNYQGAIYAIANDKEGHFFQYLIQDKQGHISGDLVRQFKLNSQPEGCVADDANNRLFIGEENKAVWTLDARAEHVVHLKKVISVGDTLKADIEGISLYQGKNQSYLIISSQGNDSYIVLDALPPFNYRGAFQVGFNTTLGIDGVSETDGLDVTAVNLGKPWQQGMLVVQDGRNRMPMENQNFKYVPWSSIASQLKLNKKNK